MLRRLLHIFSGKKCGLPFWTVFAGEFAAVSLCWCPTAVLYNYLTYLFLLLCILFCMWDLRRRKRLSDCSGTGPGRKCICPFSNLPQAVLIVGVWAYGIICRKNSEKWCRKLCTAWQAMWVRSCSFGLYQSALRRDGIPGSHKKAVFHDGNGLGLQSLRYGSGSF